MIGGVTHLGGLLGLPGRVTLSAGVAFWHVNVSRWGSPLSRIEFMLHSTSKKTTKRTQHWNLGAKAASERKRTLTTKMRRSPAIFSVYMLSDHATISRYFTPGPWGPKFACKRVLYLFRSFPHPLLRFPSFLWFRLSSYRNFAGSKNVCGDFLAFSIFQ